jgi:hypothetical protein
MIRLHEEYVVDETGNRKAVLIPIQNGINSSNCLKNLKTSLPATRLRSTHPNSSHSRRQWRKSVKSHEILTQTGARK